MWFVLNLYLQQVLGYGPFEAGSALLPMTALIMLLMVGAAAPVIGRFGLKAPIVVGMAVLAAGMGLFGFISSDGGFLAGGHRPVNPNVTGRSLLHGDMRQRSRKALASSAWSCAA